MYIGVYESNGDKDRAKDSQSFYHWSLVNIKWLSFKLLNAVIEPLQPLQNFGVNFTEKPMITVIVLIKDLKLYRHSYSYVLLFFHYIYYFAHFFSFSSACHCYLRFKWLVFIITTFRPEANFFGNIIQAMVPSSFEACWLYVAIFIVTIERRTPWK